MITRQIVLDSFKTVRGNTLEIARDIPDEKYSFCPAEGAGTVLEMFHKIIRFTEFMTTISLAKDPVVVTPETMDAVFVANTQTDISKVTTKAQVIAALESSLAGIIARVEAVPESFLNESFVAPDTITKVRLWVVNCAKEQEMGLRAQLYLTERILGIIPHTTRRQMQAQTETAKS